MGRGPVSHVCKERRALQSKSNSSGNKQTVCVKPWTTFAAEDLQVSDELTERLPSPTAPRPEANGNRLCRALQPSARPDPKRRTTLGVDEDVNKWDPHALLAERCGHWGEQPGRPRATARPGDSTRLNTRSRGHRGTWRSHSPGRTPKTRTCAPTETCTQTCTAAVFTIAPNWGRPDVHQPRMEKPHPCEGAVSRHRKGEPRHVPPRDRTLKTPCWGERQTRRPDVG